MFETLFKYPREVFERGELVFAPLPGGAGAETLIVLAVAAALALTASLLLARRMRALGAWRGGMVGLLQALFLAGVLVLLARPAIEVATLAPGTNTVAVLVDASESMGFPAAGGSTSRLERAEAVLEETVLPSLTASLAGGPGAAGASGPERDDRIATFVFGRHAERRSLDGVRAEQPRTYLLRAVEEVLAGFHGAPLAAVVVLSDGADNDPDHDMTRVVSAGVPVHTIGLGPRELPGEVQIAAVDLPADAPPESRVVADVTLEHRSAGPATVKVFDGARLIATEQVMLEEAAPTEHLTVAFDSGPGGIRELAFAVEPPPGDKLAGNNRIERLLTVDERHRRVLYLEGEPRWEYKFIRRAVGGDHVLSLTSWLRTTDRKTYRQDVHDPNELVSGLPDSKAALYRYDVIVLGSIAATYFDDDQHRWLESFVAERGGSLLALAGRDALADGGWDVTPLADALPVRLVRGAAPDYRRAEGRVRPTELGARSPIIELLGAEGADPWSSLPPLGDYQRLGALKPAAVTLLEAVIDGDAQPLLVTQPYGLGTTAVLATATTWRWQMRTPSDDQRHTLFWRQLLRQLGEAAQQPRDLRFSVTDETIDVRLVERDEHFEPDRGAAAQATVTGPGADGDRLVLVPTDRPGVLEGRYRVPDDGVYRVDVQVAGDAAPITRFVQVGGARPEHFRPAQNDALLTRLAETTGGRYWTPEQAGGIADALTFASAGVKRTERFPLWDMPALFVLLLALKGGEWILRRRWGRI